MHRSTASNEGMTELASLLHDLRHGRGPRRRRAARALGSYPDPQVVAALTEALRRDPWPVVQMWAANSLGKIGDPAAVPALCAFLTAERSEFWDLIASDAVTEALRSIGAAHALPLLLDLLRGDHRVACKAAEVLRCIASDSAEVEAAAAELVAKLEGAEGYGQYLRHLLGVLLQTARAGRANLPVPAGEYSGAASLPVPSSPRPSLPVLSDSEEQ